MPSPWIDGMGKRLPSRLPRGEGGKERWGLDYETAGSSSEKDNRIQMLLPVTRNYLNFADFLFFMFFFH